MPQQYSLCEVARLTGVAYYRLYYAFYTGQLSEPAKIGRTRIFTDKDVQKIKEHFSKKEKSTNGKTKE
jgi:DNA-binding transcriptional MerR regulator